MHWVLPGWDARGRRVVVYNAAILNSRDHAIADLQKMLCLLLERLCDDEATARRGVVVVADCRGATASMLRRFTYGDVARGSEMLADAFPCRMRALYVLGLPAVLRPLAYVVRSFLSKKQRARVHVSSTAVNRRLVADVAPRSRRASAAPADWNAVVDRPSRRPRKTRPAPVDRRASVAAT